MKKFGFPALVAALVLPVLAHGKMPLPNEIFGRIEANLHVRSEVDSKPVATYQETKKTLIQGATESTQSAPPQSSQNAGKPASAPAWQGSQVNRLSRRAEMYYEGVWGVGELHVKATESGELIRFKYRVLDPNKAKALNDKKAEPELIDAQAGVMLVIPEMEKVGKLRQSSTPKVGMTYWMAFSNPTRVVKPGHRVDVVIGQFRANSLVVE